jgi:hypothetical protein
MELEDFEAIHPRKRYEVVLRMHDGLPSSYKGVSEVKLLLHNWLFLRLAEREVYVNLNDVVSYSVRALEVGERSTTIRKLPVKPEPQRPEATPADDFLGSTHFPGPETGGESA